MNIEQAKEILGDRFSRNADSLYSFVEKINLPKDSKLLDVGTGRGSMAIILALHGYKVITGEPEGANWADWRTSAQKVNVENMIEFKPLNAEELPFSDSTFDGIFLYSTLHHIGDKRQALREFLRVLNPNGIVAIIELTDKGVELIRETWSGHPDAVDPRDYMEDSNFEVEVIKSTYLNAYIYKRKPK